MNDYSTLSVSELFERFAVYDEEREAIDEYALSLPEADLEAFLNLKRRNAVGLGLEASPFEGMQAIKVFKTDRGDDKDATVDFIAYDYSLESYKAYIDSRLSLEANNPTIVPYIIEDELNKCLGKLQIIKNERANLNSRNEFNASIASQQDLEACIAYLNNILSSITRPGTPLRTSRNGKYSENPLSPPALPDLSDYINRARKYLEHLNSQNTKRQKGLRTVDYERLLRYTNDLIEFEEVPKNVEPIYAVGKTQSHIRYTFYLIHKDLYGTRPKRGYFIDFLYAVFPSLFKDTEWNTTFTKFSQAPPSYKYDVADKG
ncbi:hypothetical protein [Pontibacter cellulosilyticus]|uniref:Uncharacterized protein n=1 Tax=Pontibacter cellulosilyticus TaxID=1720253 RepID=A0A923SMP9_9BACT|nr:hypothetical protein [Pontibacter cellulosilyticus]MBC5992410.1 hypothetical protein [Pontibacter cellulosilyticus]